MDKLLLLFKALSDETRLKIIMLLKDGELCVCDIADTLKMTQPNVSFHLAMLKDANLIRDRKNGRWTHYSLSDPDMFTRFLLTGIFEQAGKKTTGKVRRKRTC